MKFGVLLLTCLMAGPPLWSEIRFESAESQTNLLELFTSEGCSSCPPAETWFGSLQNEAGLWKSFVPVAFHVDYWNSLGWHDRYSSPVFTRRQRVYGALWNAGSIYTPEFVLNGQEWSRTGGTPPVPSGKRPGRLRVTVGGDSTVTVRFQPLTGSRFVAHIAPLTGGVTEVRAGENAGRKLRHEFVALALLSAPLESAGGGTFEAHLTLPEKLSANALAAWVSSPDDPVPLQATGGILK
jgi:hypothetical protein